MRFDTRRWNNQWEIILQFLEPQESCWVTLCYLQVGQDSINALLCGLIKTTETRDGCNLTQRLINTAGLLPQVRFGPRNRQIFFRFLHALQAFLHRPESEIFAGRSRALEELDRYLAELFQIRAEYRNGFVRYGIGGIFDLERAIQDQNFEKVPIAWWRRALHQQCDQTSLEIILKHFADLACTTLKAQDEFEGLSYITFCRALIDIVEEDENLYLPVYRVQICESIVTNRFSDADELQPYLEKILDYTDAHQADQRLSQMVEVIKKQQNEAGWFDSGYLETLAGLMGDHYLRSYDLDRVVRLWSQAIGIQLWRNNPEKGQQEIRPHKDELLSFMLRLYDRPKYMFIIVALIFGSLTFVANQNLSFSQSAAIYLFSPPEILSFFIAGLIIVGVGGSVLLTWRIFVKKDFHFVQLLLPRLWGAIVVGMAVLLLDDLPWRLGLYSSLPTWATLSITTYFLSFLYIFIDVYQATRLTASRNRAGPLIGNAVRISLKLFLIGILEAFVVALFTSTLVFPTTGLQRASEFSGGDLLGGITCLSDCPIQFGFFPGLIILWTGLSLFMGSFAQLLWQGRRITESV